MKSYTKEQLLNMLEEGQVNLNVGNFYKEDSNYVEHTLTSVDLTEEEEELLETMKVTLLLPETEYSKNVREELEEGLRNETFDKYSTEYFDLVTSLHWEMCNGYCDFYVNGVVPLMYSNGVELK